MDSSFTHTTAAAQYRSPSLSEGLFEEYIVCGGATCVICILRFWARKSISILWSCMLIYLIIYLRFFLSLYQRAAHNVCGNRYVAMVDGRCEWMLCVCSVLSLAMALFPRIRPEQYTQWGYMSVCVWVAKLCKYYYGLPVADIRSVVGGFIGCPLLCACVCYKIVCRPSGPVYVCICFAKTNKYYRILGTEAVTFSTVHNVHCNLLNGMWARNDGRHLLRLL